MEGILGVLLVCLAGFTKAVMDKLQFHWHKSIFALNPGKYTPLFWDPSVSWANKYKPGTNYKEEKFKFSTTLLVFLTDAWHFFQMCTTFLLFVGILMIGYGADSLFSLIFVGVIARVVYGVTFELFFKKWLGS